MVPAEVTTMLQDMAVDALYVAGAFLLSVIAVKALKHITLTAPWR